MGRSILHVDANSFYASVEQQRRPELRGKAVAVCGSEENRHGIVLTASYPAKWKGVRTGMAVWQARQVCPELIVLPPDMGEYMRISRLARDIYERYTDQVEPFGLDEAWLDVTGSLGLFGQPMDIAREISRRVKFELGITVSIGVSDNKVTAKLGSDYKKPDAITRIGRDNYEPLVYPLPVEDLLYVGPATKKRLNRYCIRTIGQLAGASDEFLRYQFGKMGGVLKTFALGLDPSPVQKTDHISAIKSVGNSATAPRDLVCGEDIRIMCILLSESVCSRMRELASKCTVVELSVRNSQLESFVRQKKLAVPTCSSLEMAQTAMELFQENYSWEYPVRSIGVRGAGLVEGSGCVQLSLYRDEEQRERRERLDEAVDGLRDRFGYMSVQRAVIYQDRRLAGIHPREHVVHPVGFFGR